MHTDEVGICVDHSRTFLLLAFLYVYSNRETHTTLYLIHNTKLMLLLLKAGGVGLSNSI